MPRDYFQPRIDAVRARIDADHVDPRGLHDDLQHLVDDLDRVEGHVPADLREAVEALQAEIVEDFYDNLPV